MVNDNELFWVQECTTMTTTEECVYLENKLIKIQEWLINQSNLKKDFLKKIQLFVNVQIETILWLVQ